MSFQPMIGSADPLWQAMRQHHRNRVIELHSSLTTDANRNRSYMMMHLIPESAMTSRKWHSATELKQCAEGITPPGSKAYNHQFNSHGYRVSAGTGPDSSYTQLYREGHAEGVVPCLVSYEYRRGFRVEWLECAIVDLTTNYRELARKIKIEATIGVFVSLIGCKNIAAVLGRDETDERIDSDYVHFPGIEISAATDDLQPILHPLADAMWQCFGIDFSPTFDRRQ